MTTLREQMLITANGFITAFNTNSPEGLIAHRAPNCTQRVIPQSTGHPIRSNSEYQAFLAPSFQVMKNFHLKLGDDPVVDEVSRKVVLHLSPSAETPLGKYESEYIFTLGMSEDGKQIENVVEFVDTANVGDFMPRMMKWIEENM